MRWRKVPFGRWIKYDNREICFAASRCNVSELLTPPLSFFDIIIDTAHYHKTLFTHTQCVRYCRRTTLFRGSSKAHRKPLHPNDTSSSSSNATISLIGNPVFRRAVMSIYYNHRNDYSRCSCTPRTLTRRCRVNSNSTRHPRSLRFRIHLEIFPH